VNSPRLIFYFLIFPLALFFLTCSESGRLKTNIDSAQVKTIKQRGAHIFGHNDTSIIQYCLEENYEWITRVPWAYQADYNSSEMDHHFGDSAKVKRRDSSWVANMKWIRSFGFKTFIKPHVWLHAPTNNSWRSDIFPDNEGDWEQWKEDYRQWILRYARVAEKAEAEMFCIGTELTRVSLEKPEYWRALIKEVRSIYSGKLTYAANWYQEYEQITFWDDLDYIGVQAYFPLAENEHATVEEISNGWSNYLPKLEVISKKFDRKVIFTEMGYRSIPSAAIRPWEWMEKDSVNHTFSEETQANCYQAFFESVWDKDWFSGVHIWQLRSSGRRRIAENNLDFYPKDKLAEDVIRKGFE